MSNAPHRLRSHYDGMDAIGYVFDIEGANCRFYQIGSATGPLTSMYADMGTLQTGDVLRLAYDYTADRYTREGWNCIVVRINQKSVTVTDAATGENHRITL